MSIEKALDAIRKGQVILIYDFDDREKESDMTVASQFVTHDIIRQMRQDAGGLLCTTTPYRLAKAIGLPRLLGRPREVPCPRTHGAHGHTL